MIQRGMGIADYHAHPAIGSGDLRQILKTPAHYRANRSHGRASLALEFGAAFHAAVLEPDQWAARYVVIPDHVRRGTKAFAELAADVPIDATVLTQTTEAAIFAMRDSVRSHPSGLVRDLLAHGAIEESIFWSDPATGMECKCRPDLRQPGVVADLKSAADASPSGFRRALYQYGYHIQGAHYCEGCARELGGQWDEFVFIVVEKEPPYAVAVYRLEPDALAAGRHACGKALEKLYVCREMDSWNGYSAEVQDIGLPPWAE